MHLRTGQGQGLGICFKGRRHRCCSTIWPLPQFCQLLGQEIMRFNEVEDCPSLSSCRSSLNIE